MDSYAKPRLKWVPPFNHLPIRVVVVMISRTLFILAVLTLSLSACNTWSGFGQDMQQLGKKIQKQGDKDNKD